jgi:hypothetical protein
VQLVCETQIFEEFGFGHGAVRKNYVRVNGKGYLSYNFDPPAVVFPGLVNPNPDVMTTTPICPECRKTIPVEDINVVKDVAYCRSCNLGHELSELVQATADPKPANLAHPPPGTWYRAELSGGIVIGASHRSWGAALGLLGISLFWNGIVSVFVLFAISGTLHQLGWAVPEWFPAPKMNGHTMGLGEVIFLWLFLTPFIAIGSVLIVSFISTVCGRTEVYIQHGLGRVFVGIGRLGWTRRFDPAKVANVELAPRSWRNTDADPQSQLEVRLEMQEGKVIKCGSLLNEERQRFLLSALRQTVLFPVQK